MLRLVVPIILGAIMIASIIDIAMIDRSRVRHLPKTVWILAVILLSVIGTILWVGLGRGRPDRSDTTSPLRPKRPVAPDDDPNFIDTLAAQRQREIDERIKEIERQLAELEAEEEAQGAERTERDGDQGGPRPGTSGPADTQHP